MNVKFRFLIAGTILGLLMCASPGQAQQANVQFIHNFHSADHAVLDVYLNILKPAGLNDLRYRRATPFFEVDPGIYEITLTDASSTSVGEGKLDDGVFINTGQLVADGYYVFVISGVRGDGFQDPGDGRDLTYTIERREVRNTRQNNAQAEFVLFHTGTDVPAFDFLTDFRSGTPDVDDLAYNAFSGYVSIDPGNYVFTLANDLNQPIRGFEAPIVGFNEPFVVVASGFYTPEDEPEAIAADHEFGMYAVRPSGSVVPFPEIGSDIQIIHNSGFPNTDVIDVYINGEKPDALDDLAFRSAAPYITTRSGIRPEIRINGDESTDSDDNLIREINPNFLIPGQDYAVVINGLIEDAGFENGDPGNRDLALDIVLVEVDKASSADDRVDIYTVHGVTDAPSIDIFTNLEGSPLMENVRFGDDGPPVTVPNGVYSFSVTENNSKIDLIGRWFADLSEVGGQSIVLFASGFVTTENEPVVIPKAYEMKLYAALGNGDVIEMPFVARMQVIHSASDPAAETVDIYVNGFKPMATDNLSFLGATPYIDLPAEVDLTVTFAQPSSSGPTNRVIKEIMPGQLTRYTEYVGVAVGLNDPADYENPDSENRDLNLGLSIAEARSEADVDINAEFLAIHGVTDAPAVDFRIDGIGAPPIANLDYADISDYVSLAPEGFILRVTAAGNEDLVVQSYDLNLSAFEGQSVSIFAHGFVTPENEPAVLGEVYNFGLSMAAADGTVTPLTVAVEDAAQIQFLNNSAMTEAGTVDIYINGKRLAGTDDLAFRSATPFINVPANETLDLVVAEGASTRSDDRVLHRRSIGPLNTDSEHFLIVNGVDEDDYENPDPGTRDIKIQTYLIDAVSTSPDAGTFALVAFHGVTDAPELDVFGLSLDIPVIPGLDYGQQSTYLALPNGDYVFTVTESGNVNNIIGLYAADLNEDGGAGLVFASGFATLDGEPGTVPATSTLGVYIMRPDGSVTELFADAPDLANVQLIHNSPDPAAAVVDIYINGSKTPVLDDVPFRGATEFLGVPAGQANNIVVAGSSSTGVDSEVILSMTLPAMDVDQRYAAIVNGVAGEGFNNPVNGRDISLDVDVLQLRSEPTENPNNFEFTVFHGSTDAPDVDVVLTDDGTPLLSNLAFGSFSDYISESPAVFDVTVTAAGDPNTVAGQYFLNTDGLGGQTGVLLACGFLTPGDEPGTVPSGYDLRLCLVLEDGSVRDFPVVTSVGETPREVKASSIAIYPQPANGQATIAYELVEAGLVRAELFDQTGRPLGQIFNGFQGIGKQVLPLDLAAQASGTFTVRVSTLSGSFDIQVVNLR